MLSSSRPHPERPQFARQHSLSTPRGSGCRSSFRRFVFLDVAGHTQKLDTVGRCPVRQRKYVARFRKLLSVLVSRNVPFATRGTGPFPHPLVPFEMRGWPLLIWNQLPRFMLGVR